MNDNGFHMCKNQLKEKKKKVKENEFFLPSQRKKNASGLFLERQNNISVYTKD